MNAEDRQPRPRSQWRSWMAAVGDALLRPGQATHNAQQAAHDATEQIRHRHQVERDVRDDLST